MSTPTFNVDDPIGCLTTMVNQRVCIRKERHNNKLACIGALPDTSASIDCKIEKIVKNHGFIVAPGNDNMIELIKAEGNLRKVTGTTTLEIHLPKGVGLQECHWSA